MSCFVRPAVQNPKILSLLSHMTKTSIKSSANIWHSYIKSHLYEYWLIKKVESIVCPLTNRLDSCSSILMFRDWEVKLPARALINKQMQYVTYEHLLYFTSKQKECITFCITSHCWSCSLQEAVKAEAVKELQRVNISSSVYNSVSMSSKHQRILWAEDLCFSEGRRRSEPSG